MFVTLVHCHVKQARLDAFIEATRVNHEASILEPGNLRFDVIQLEEDPTRFVLYEWYVDEAAVAEHRTMPHYHAWREATADCFEEPRYGIRYRGLFPADVAGAADAAGRTSDGTGADNGAGPDAPAQG